MKNVGIGLDWLCKLHASSAGLSWGLYFSAYNRAKERYQKSSGQTKLAPQLHLLSAAEAGCLVSPFELARMTQYRSTSVYRIIAYICSEVVPRTAYGDEEKYRVAASISTCAHYGTGVLQGCSAAYAFSHTLFAFIDSCCQAVDGLLADLPVMDCAGVLRDKPNLGDQDKTTAAARFWPHCVTKVTSNCDSPAQQCWAIQGLCACC